MSTGALRTPELSVAAANSGDRPWHWPFEARRLLTLPQLRGALALLFAGFLLRIAAASTLGLSDDEAWYWGLSKDLRTSYLVHPPLSMWMIRASTTLFGDTLLGVRAPSIVCSTLGAFLLVRLAARFGWAKGAEAIAFLCLSTPLLFLGGILMGPDLPLFLFWTAAMERSYLIATGQDTRAQSWMKLGLCLGLATLSKYTAVLAILAALVSILILRPRQKELQIKKALLMLGIIAIALCPILVWNITNNWASFSFQFLERHDGFHADFRRWGVFFIAQVFLFGPVAVFGWFLLLRDVLKTRASRERSNLIFLAVWALAPSIFFIQPLFSPFKIHWALYAYLPVLVYFARLASQRPVPKLVRTAASTSISLTIAGMLMLYLPILGVFTPANQDFSNDFYGWDLLRPRMERLPTEMRRLPILATRYQIAAQSAFALGTPNNVKIFSGSSDVQDWKPIASLPEEFLYVTDNRYNDAASTSFPVHDCATVEKIIRKRGPFLAKEIGLQRCVQRLQATNSL